MANVVPGVRWEPIAIDYSKRARRRKGRGLIGHIAVSNAANLPGNPTGNNWHFYLPYEGPAIQYIDLDFVSGASKAGDASCASFESQGGLGATAEVNRQRWNANQAWWAARILRHMHDTEGVPLEVMPNSRPESRGFGTHRLGVDPYRVAGGESWSSSYGKACPGDARHAQRQEIVDLARTIGDDDVSAEDVWNGLISHGVVDKTGGPQTAKTVLGDIFFNVRNQGDTLSSQSAAITGLTAAVNVLAGAVASGRDDLTAEELRAVIREEMANVVDVQVTVRDGNDTAS